MAHGPRLATQAPTARRSRSGRSEKKCSRPSSQWISRCAAKGGCPSGGPIATPAMGARTGDALSQRNKLRGLRAFGIWVDRRRRAASWLQRRGRATVGHLATRLRGQTPVVRADGVRPRSFGYTLEGGDDNSSYRALVRVEPKESLLRTAATEWRTGPRLATQAPKSPKVPKLWFRKELVAPILSVDLALRSQGGCPCGAPSPHQRWGRSEERRVGKECRSRWSPYH